MVCRVVAQEYILHMCSTTYLIQRHFIVSKLTTTTSQTTRKTKANTRVKLEIHIYLINYAKRVHPSSFTPHAERSLCIYVQSCHVKLSTMYRNDLVILMYAYTQSINFGNLCSKYLQQYVGYLACKRWFFNIFLRLEP